MKYLYRIGWYLAYTYWFIARPKARGAMVIVEKDDKILLVRHTYGHRNDWFLPGGGQKRRENPEATATRELLEEVGLELDLKYLGEISGYADHRQITDSYFLARANGETLQVDKKEIGEHKWWPKQALPDSLNRLARNAIEKFS